MDLPRAKKVKMSEQISCDQNQETTSSTSVQKEEAQDNIEVKEEPKDEYMELKEELKDEYVEVKKEPKDEPIELAEKSKDEFTGLVPKLEYQEELKHNIKKEVEEASEDESDDGHLDAEDVQEIIAGKKKISFLGFKDLVECGKLKKEDLALMRSAQVVEVPDKGEVIQFMQTSVKNFNKIDLKELSRDDVQPNMGRKQLWVMAKLDGMFSKKGTMLTCKPCQFVTPDVASMMNHIKDSHADLLAEVLSGGNMYDSWSWANHNAKKTIRTCLEQMCDPSLEIEDVVISSETRKKFMKEDESNIYEEAANLVSKVIDVRTSKVGKRRFYVHLCKSCGINFAPDVEKNKHEQKRGSRRRLIEHLALVHVAEYQALADIIIIIIIIIIFYIIIIKIRHWRSSSR